MTTQRQRAAAVKAIGTVWESHGDGYLSPGLFEAMAQAALEAAEAAAWQPIETAPRDGTPVFAITDEGIAFCAKIRVIDDGHPMEFGNLTHWRPPPAPPKVP